MRIVDVHNHFYPPAYLDAIRAGDSVLKYKEDADGNPEVHYPATTTSRSAGTATSRIGRACSSRRASTGR